VIQPITNFYKNNTLRDGVTNQCKLCINKKHKEDYRLFKDKFVKRRKELYYRYRDAAIRNAVEWGRKNKEKRDISKKKWASNNKERINHYAKERSYRENGAEGRHTLKEWEDLCESVGGVCVCCGEKKGLTRDHIVPLTKGGTNYISNIQPLCISCNSKKGNRSSANYLIVFSGLNS
jgi:5-methylcytosine-specific restriction endonuclease McrA